MGSGTGALCAASCVQAHIEHAVQARALRFSVMQHLARVRRVYNLFEDDDVVGITNYLDFGMAVETPFNAMKDENPQKAAEATEFEAAAAWQVC